MSIQLQVIGIVGLFIFFFYVVKFWLDLLYCYGIGPSVNKVDFKSKGKWALVTGCTDGIGKQYALQLAARGCDIVLVSRSLEKLKATAQEIENTHKVTTKIIQAEFAAEEDVYERIEKEIEGLEIGTLVNNVGISYAYPEYFLELPEWDKIISSLIRANIVAVTRMTKMIMPAMVQRKKGVVINIGSASSIIPSPLLTVYAATKAYITKFSEGLEMEYSKQGLIIQSVMPGFVCSNMSGIRKRSFFAPTAEEFVKSALGLVGTMTKTTGYLPHSVFVGTITYIYNISSTFGVWLVMKSLENSRRKILKKLQKKQ